MLGLVVTLLFLLTTSSAIAQTDPIAPLRDNVRSVVQIRVEGITGDGAVVSNAGTGFFVSGTGHILTAGHLFRKPEDGSSFWKVSEAGLKMRISFRRVTPQGILSPALERATLLQIDEKLDVALLRGEGVDGESRPLACSSESMPVGSLLQGVGWRPDQEVFDVILGTAAPADFKDPQRIRMIGVSRPGNSGSPLFDKNGKVVAILTAGTESAGKPFAETYATPISRALYMLPRPSACRDALLGGPIPFPDAIFASCVEQISKVKQGDLKFVSIQGSVRTQPSGLTATADEATQQVVLRAPPGNEIVPPAKVNILSAMGNHSYEGPEYVADASGRVVEVRVTLRAKNRGEIFSPGSWLHASIEASTRVVLDEEARKSAIKSCSKNP